MSNPAQGDELAPDADEVGDGGANIDQQPGEDTLGDDDADQRKSQDRQADGDFPIMS